MIIEIIRWLTFPFRVAILICGIPIFISAALTFTVCDPANWRIPWGSTSDIVRWVWNPSSL